MLAEAATGSFPILTALVLLPAFGALVVAVISKRYPELVKLAGLVFTIVNFFVKPVLAVLSIPFIIVTFGIFYFLINVLMLYLTHWIVPQFTLATFWWAALAAIIISMVNGILHMLFGNPREELRRLPA